MKKFFVPDAGLRTRILKPSILDLFRCAEATNKRFGFWHDDALLAVIVEAENKPQDLPIHRVFWDVLTISKKGG